MPLPFCCAKASMSSFVLSEPFLISSRNRSYSPGNRSHCCFYYYRSSTEAEG